MTEGNILARYEHQDGNEIRRLPVCIRDVDEMWIWLVVRNGFTEWNVPVPWSWIVANYLPTAIRTLEEDLQKEIDATGDPRLEFLSTQVAKEESGKLPDDSTK